MAAFDGTIEVVRGRLTEERSDQLLRFWSDQAVLDNATARRRLSEVVCVLLDAQGEIAGVNSVYPRDLRLIGGRKFWIYRRFLVPDASDTEDEMINAAFNALEDEYERGAGGPIGLCLLVADPAEMQRRPEAVWPETELIFAGYRQDGQQVRIRYFEDAVVGPGLPNSPTLREMRQIEYPLEDRYRIEPFDRVDEVTQDDVLALWEREGAVSGEEARRRANEVFLVALERDEGLVGVSTAYIQRNPQLRMDLWHFRLFVAEAHRNSNLGAQLSLHARDLLQERYVSGEDTRAPGMLYELENPGLMRYLNSAMWMSEQGRSPEISYFIGENEYGHHVRVRYFPGTMVPGLEVGGGDGY
jgi:hypothetical protein